MDVKELVEWLYENEYINEYDIDAITAELTEFYSERIVNDSY